MTNHYIIAIVTNHAQVTFLFVQVGGAVSLNGLIDIFHSVAESQGDAYKHAEAMANHIQKVCRLKHFFISTIAI